MTSGSAILQYATAAAAIYCAIAYLYGFIWRGNEDRPVHGASLLFTGMALGALAAVIPVVISEANAFAIFCATAFLIASVGCQTYCSFADRWRDRHSADQGQDEDTLPVLRFVAGRSRKAA